MDLMGLPPRRGPGPRAEMRRRRCSLRDRTSGFNRSLGGAPASRPVPAAPGDHWAAPVSFGVGMSSCRLRTPLNQVPGLYHFFSGSPLGIGAVEAGVR